MGNGHVWWVTMIVQCAWRVTIDWNCLVGYIRNNFCVHHRGLYMRCMSKWQMVNQKQKWRLRKITEWKQPGPFIVPFKLFWRIVTSSDPTRIGSPLLTGFDPIKIRVKLRLKQDLAQQRLTLKSRRGGQPAVAHCGCSKGMISHNKNYWRNSGGTLRQKETKRRQTE